MEKNSSTSSSVHCDDDKKILGLSTDDVDDILVVLGGESLRSDEKIFSQSSKRKCVDNEDSTKKTKIAQVRKKFETVTSPSSPKCLYPYCEFSIPVVECQNKVVKTKCDD